MAILTPASRTLIDSANEIAKAIDNIHAIFASDPYAIIAEAIQRLWNLYDELQALVVMLVDPATVEATLIVPMTPRPTERQN